MKRELKFKAWDTTKKMFVPQGEIIFSDYGDSNIEVNPNCLEYIGDACHNGEPQRSRFIIVQFTGLTDNEGKEVYEGDIVEIDWFHVNDKTYETISYDSSFGYYKYGNAPLCELTDRHTFKVIGNIYENEATYTGA